ncbi:MAG: rhodanese-like domain-containing protein [Chloroflexota bacterium]|nr:rhodanese-like domain-containing protein [Chloroflexota bacterium]
MSYTPDEGDFDLDYEEEPSPPRRAPQQRVAAPPAAAKRNAPTVQADRRPAAPRRKAPARSTAASMVLGFMGALIVGLLGLIIVLLLQRPNTGPVASGGTTNLPAASGGAPPPAGAPAAGSAPPRMPLAEFKALYDDPAKRPVIVDVRAADAYAQGHIVGAISIPEADLATRLSELPKDKLVVAYCQ